MKEFKYKGAVVRPYEPFYYNKSQKLPQAEDVASLINNNSKSMTAVRLTQLRA